MYRQPSGDFINIFGFCTRLSKKAGADQNGGRMRNRFVCVITFLAAPFVESSVI
jgi:hypothetical protein